MHRWRTNWKSPNHWKVFELNISMGHCHRMKWNSFLVAYKSLRCKNNENENENDIWTNSWTFHCVIWSIIWHKKRTNLIEISLHYYMINVNKFRKQKKNKKNHQKLTTISRNERAKLNNNNMHPKFSLRLGVWNNQATACFVIKLIYIYICEKQQSLSVN